MGDSSFAMSRKSRKAASLSHVYYSNAVYFSNRSIYHGHTPGSLNYSCISTVYYSFASVTSDGSVLLSDEYADTQAPCDGVSGGFGSLMRLKQKHPHLQVILSIGGPQCSQIFPTVAGNAVYRDNFARSARGLVEASGLDGIDIVWQYPTDAVQGANFLALLAATRTHLPEEHYLLTALLPSSRTVLAAIDLARAADYLDLLNLQAYDFHGPWSARSGHHAQLYPASSKDDEAACGAGAVAFVVAQGFPARKVLFGVPLFGRSFPGVAGPGHRFGKISGEGTVEYGALPRRGAKEGVDRRAGAAFCVSGGSTGFSSYDNPETVKIKAGFVKKKGLGGLFYWTAPMDSKDSKRSLVAAGFRALHSSG